ncbi:hypothetical protein CLV40_11682 [Actinokineospora auranticolor]|uniref:Uncharacterized protein n=2 Tax=Actinokineospora auranticolor TaxID=155976 RepID=A0A2S6GIJ4_9PSEU|nr:hypothetical protein CLV40_11682 [Actinokineospora auranticolor]
MQPPFWVVHALDIDEWSTEAMVEGAFAFDTRFVKEGTHPPHALDVASCCRRYAREHPDQRVVFFTDVTRWLDEQGSSWAALEVDWLSALNYIPGNTLGLFMTVSRRALMHIGNAAIVHRVHYGDGSSEVLTEGERDAVRQALAEKLADDWPPFIRGLIDRGQLALG